MSPNERSRVRAEARRWSGDAGREPYGVRLTLSGIKKEPERGYRFAGNAGVWTLLIDASFTSDKDELRPSAGARSEPVPLLHP